MVVGVSPDTVANQAKFKTQEQLPFILLADEKHEVAELYGVWGEKTFAGKTYWGVHRTTFLIGPDGTIEKIFHDVKPQTHSEQVLVALTGLD